MAGGIKKVYKTGKSVDELKTELLFCFPVRSGGHAVKLAGGGFKRSASLHSRQWASGAGCHGDCRERGCVSRLRNNLMLTEMNKLRVDGSVNV